MKEISTQAKQLLRSTYYPNPSTKRVLLLEQSVVRQTIFRKQSYVARKQVGIPWVYTAGFRVNWRIQLFISPKMAKSTH